MRSKQAREVQKTISVLEKSITSKKESDSKSSSKNEQGEDKMGGAGKNEPIAQENFDSRRDDK